LFTDKARGIDADAATTSFSIVVCAAAEVFFSLLEANLSSIPQCGEDGVRSADVGGGEVWMTDRTELLEVALDSLPEGFALVGGEGQILLWNRAAEAISGHASVDLLSRPAPEPLKPLLLGCKWLEDQGASPGGHPWRGAMVHFQHKLGHDVPVIVRTLMLRDGLGERMGTAVVFHPAQSVDALPHGECDDGSSVEASQAEFEDRLAAVFDDFRQSGDSFGVLWITVDETRELRKTHGAGACEAMLEKVKRAMANGLRPAEEIGRWGDDEFLVLSHERTREMLAAHAQVLAGLARTAEFRWWGDRISLTASIGAAQANRDGSLADLLERARAAMLTSYHAGGNHITLAPGEPACSPS
jgi:diguanylate cyclase (GGDEF)-like protein/PAS domain S-box-containing protein